MCPIEFYRSTKVSPQSGRTASEMMDTNFNSLLLNIQLACVICGKILLKRRTIYFKQVAKKNRSQIAGFRLIISSNVVY